MNLDLLQGYYGRKRAAGEGGCKLKVSQATGHEYYWSKSCSTSTSIIEVERHRGMGAVWRWLRLAARVPKPYYRSRLARKEPSSQKPRHPDCDSSPRVTQVSLQQLSIPKTPGTLTAGGVAVTQNLLAPRLQGLAPYLPG